MKKGDLKAILKTALAIFTGSRLAYEKGYDLGFEDGKCVGRQEGRAEGVRVWAAAAAENEKSKAKV